MPTVVFAANETDATRPFLTQCYYRAPLKQGEKFEDRFNQKDKARRLYAGALIKAPTLDDAAGVLCYAYGGTEKIARKGEKRFMQPDEVAFLNRNHPGLIDVVSEDGGPDDVTPILLEKTKDAERQRDLALAEAEQAKNALLTTSAQKNQAEQAAATAALESAAAQQTIADLKAQLAAANALLDQKRAVDTTPASNKADDAPAPDDGKKPKTK